MRRIGGGIGVKIGADQVVFERVDFLVSGYDDKHCANVVIIELR